MAGPSKKIYQVNYNSRTDKRIYFQKRHNKSLG